MPYEQKNGQGSLFKNDRKAQDTHADYRGDCTIDGRAYWLNAWVKETKGGKKYFSLSIKPKVQEEKPRTLAQQRPQDFDDDKSLPF
jgi:hypothetical protein